MLDFVNQRNVNKLAFVGYGAGVSLSYEAIAPLLALGDFLIIVVASLAGGIAYQRAIGDTIGDVQSFVGVGILTGVVYCLGARHAELYRLQSLLQRRHDYWRIVGCFTFAFFFLTVILFLLKSGNQFSRGSVICFAALATGGLVAWRVYAHVQLRRALTTGQIRGRRAVIVGHGNELAELAASSLLVDFGIHETARIAIPRIKSGDAISKRDVAAIKSAILNARTMPAEEVLLCVSWGDRTQLQLLLDQLRVVPLPVRLLPDSFVRSIYAPDGATRSLHLLDIQRAPLTRVEQIIKRWFDLAVASSGLLILLPLMAMVALALSVEAGGPVIFKQRRRGFNDREFEIYKFRTMKVLEDGPVIRQACRGDERVTVIGRVLRWTSIDELPQLFNVLKGEMSIVGPRPHAVAHDDEYEKIIANYAFRHHVKPGITGLAQVSGLRGATPRVELMQQRVEQDLWYINNWSIMLDLWITARTCIELMRPRNAY